MAHSLSVLTARHEVSSFTCGNADLDTYLRATAGQHQAKKLARTYVLTDEAAPDVIIGYFTLAIRPMTPKGEMPAALVKKLPSRVPGYTLARLAVAEQYQRLGHGETMLMAAMDKAKAAAEGVGGYALFVDAKDGGAARFYEKYGFVAFPSNPLILALPIARIPDRRDGRRHTP